MVQLSGIAYCCGTLGHGVDSWDCHACKKFPDVQAISFSAKGFSDQNGFVSYDPHDGAGSINVVFTGTDPLKIKEWIDDIDTISVGYPRCSGCEVHQGFYDNFKAVSTKYMELLDRFASNYSHAPIYVSGHSLGAAVSVHAALEIVRGQYGTRLRSLYNFGSPRVGNAAFASWAQGALKGVSHFRVSHHKDPVPHLPMEDMIFSHFHHVSTEVFYPGSSSGSFKICDGSGEDKSCSDQYIADIDLIDHTQYVGFDMISNYLYCKL